MATLADLKADIASDFARGDLTTEIAAAITRAIEYFQPTRFWFNETRDLTFNTVIGQARYTSADDADIPGIITLDATFITVGGQNRELDWVYPDDYELAVDSSASTGEPYCYTRLNETIGLYPLPDAVYTIRLQCHYVVDAPTSDADAANLWIVNAYQLIRSRAAWEIASKKVRDYDFARLMAGEVDYELNRLNGQTSKRLGTGQIQATSF